jgi:hypothetical protein
MHTRYLVIVAAALALSGCSTVNQSVAFNAADFKAYEAPGKALIQGHAFVRTADNAKHTAAGLNVYLVPLTPYTAERGSIMRSGKTPSPADPSLGQYVKTEVADIGGAFTFTGLPAGSYLVYCKIAWYARSRRAQGGDYYAVGKADVSEGEKKHLVVTNNSE